MSHRPLPRDRRLLRRREVQRAFGQGHATEVLRGSSAHVRRLLRSAKQGTAGGGQACCARGAVSHRPLHMCRPAFVQPPAVTRSRRPAAPPPVPEVPGLECPDSCADLT